MDVAMENEPTTEVTNTSEENAEEKFGRRTKVNIIQTSTDEQRKKLPLEKSFRLEARSIIDDKMYTGDFTIKKLTLGAMSKKGVIKASLSAGQPVDMQTEFLHEQMAHVRVAVTKHENADWFDKLDGLCDADILFALYKEVTAFEASFRAPVGK